MNKSKQQLLPAFVYQSNLIIRICFIPKPAVKLQLIVYLKQSRRLWYNSKVVTKCHDANLTANG